MIDPKNLRDVLSVCKEFGVSRLKTNHLEVDITANATTHDTNQVPWKAHPPIDPEKEKEIQHKIEEFKSVMSLSDDEILDRNFPLPKEEIN